MVLLKIRMDCPKCGSPMDKKVEELSRIYTCFCCNNKMEENGKSTKNSDFAIES